MIENMILTSYLDKFASLGGYVSSVQRMSLNKLKHQVRQQFSLCDHTCDVSFVSHWKSRYTLTGKQVDAAIDAFLV